jgi:predicted MPP superfamily phosphohydrolase
MKEEKRFMIYKIIIIVVVLIVLTLLWARFISTKGLVVKEYPIYTSLMDEKYDGFKVVQFSDLHFGSTVFIDEVKEMVKQINNQHPDVIVFTGDLIEHGVIVSDDNLNALIEELNKLEANIGIYAVMGNHDYDQMEYFTKVNEQVKWKLLKNSFEYVYEDTNTPIVFVGIDDYWMGDPVYKDAYQFLHDNNKDLYTILLLHEPDQIDHLNDFTENTNYSFNLALSGHSHLGQVRLPFIGAMWTPYGAKKYYDEHYKLGDNKDLYISGGVGTSSMKLRFFNKPSISVFRFYTK